MALKKIDEFRKANQVWLDKNYISKQKLREDYNRLTDLEVLSKWFKTPESRIEANNYLKNLQKVLIV